MSRYRYRQFAIPGKVPMDYGAVNCVSIPVPLPLSVKPWLWRPTLMVEDRVTGRGRVALFLLPTVRVRMDSPTPRQVTEYTYTPPLSFTPDTRTSLSWSANEIICLRRVRMELPKSSMSQSRYRYRTYINIPGLSSHPKTLIKFSSSSYTSGHLMKRVRTKESE